MTLKNQFTSLMEEWAKCAVEKISLIIKVSMCETEDDLAAKPRAGQEQVTRPKKSKSLGHLERHFTFTHRLFVL